jgi:sigma-B regulation protein RsbU (phosphoserine phosphatase)
MFVTVFLGILNLKTGILTHTNAGHNPTYIKRSDGNVEKLTELHGVVVAAMEGLTYKESTSQINAGDLIFAYTDGIPEAHNTKGAMFGDDQLLDYLRESTLESSEKLVKQIFKKVREFEDGADKFDDVTALSVYFYGTKSEIF